MDDAIRDGDPIHAVIRNSACNHCGRSEGITMPSRTAQEKLLWEVHEQIGLSPSETPVVEVCMIDLVLLILLIFRLGSWHWHASRVSDYAHISRPLTNKQVIQLRLEPSLLC